MCDDATVSKKSIVLEKIEKIPLDEKRNATHREKKGFVSFFRV